MATKIGQELVEFTFSQASRDINGVKGYSTADLDRFVKTFEAYEREFKRVFGSMVTTVSEFNAKTGQLVKGIYVPSEYRKEAMGVRSAVALQRGDYNDSEVMYTGISKSHYLETTREIKGAKAQQFAREAVIDAGGRIIHTPNTANKDMMTTFIPISDAQLSGMSGKDVATYVRNVTPDSNTASRAEAMERARKEREAKQKELEAQREAQLERDAKRQRDHLKDRRKQNEIQKKADERKQREEAKAKEQEEKDKIASRKQTLGRIGKAIAILGTIADITRRILTSVMSFASETSKQQTKANTLNMGLQDVRGFNYFDKALGLDAGTQMQAQEDLRTKFGNTAKLDTEALKWLAMVMGDKVVHEIQSGLGGENPAYLMEEIMDDFFKRQQEGVDQYGNYVGQDKARRALVTLLESVSPSIARTFERMVEEQTSGLHAGEITSFRQLQSLYLPATGTLNATDWEMITLLGKEADELKAKFANLGDLIKGELTLAFKDTISALNNLHIGQNEEEAFLEDVSDYERLSAWRAGYIETRKGTTERLEEYFSKSSALKGMSIDDIIMYAGYETAGTEGEERLKIQSARDAVQALYQNPSLYNDLLMYYTSADLIEAIDKETKGGNPNADSSKYGDASIPLMKKAVEAKYLSLIGFLKSGEMDFTDAIFTRSIGAGDLRYGDVVANKQKYFASGAQEFFGLASTMSKGSAYGKAVKDVLKQYKKVYGVDYNIDDLYDAIKRGDTSWNSILNDLFTFGTMYSGLDASTRTTMQSFAKYLPDEYGLTTGEWGDIYDKIGDVLSKNKYKNHEILSASLSQGSSAGTIDITVNLKDTKTGKITAVKETVKGTIESDAKLDKDLQLVTD